MCYYMDSAFHWQINQKWSLKWLKNPFTNWTQQRQKTSQEVASLVQLEQHRKTKSNVVWPRSVFVVKTLPSTHVVVTATLCPWFTSEHRMVKSSVYSTTPRKLPSGSFLFIFLQFTLTFFNIPYNIQWIFIKFRKLNLWHTNLTFYKNTVIYYANIGFYSHLSSESNSNTLGLSWTWSFLLFTSSTHWMII